MAMISKEFVLPSGVNVSVRPARPGDIQAIIDMHERLSRTSIYYRYLRPRAPSDEDIDAMCSPDEGEGAVLVATVGEDERTIVGLGQYARDPQRPSHAEPALLVEDRFQGQGIGNKLFERLIRNAVAHRVRVFDAFIDAQNHRVMRLLKSTGLPYEGLLAHGTRELRLRLDGVRRTETSSVEPAGAGH
jgi:GNAT superfamily N-acetyltransferase